MLTTGLRQLMLTAEVAMEDITGLALKAAVEDPDEGLRAIAALRRLLDHLELLHVRRARVLGWSWEQIAASLGVTKQTVHRKHRGRVR
jgi:DNA-directed RNA polymerase specialized sigma24 family protein